MRLIADEGVERAIVERLRHECHHVVYVAELSPSVTDEEVLRQANDLGALLLTSDKDFGDIVYRLGRVHAGVILLRLAGLQDRSKAESVVEAIRDHADEMIGAFSVISPGQIRIRRSPRE